MPGINVIKVLGHLKFASYMLKMPVEWKQPQGDPDAGQYSDATRDFLGGAPEQPIPFFLPHNAHKYHWDAANETGKSLQEFHDDMLDAVAFSHNMWKVQAKFKDLKVMAVSAIGAPGCLDGPELESNIKNAPSAMKYATGNAAKWRDAVAAGVSKCFKNWQDKVMVPGLPWYPAFAAFPGPQAPPMPNVPMPLITCPSAMMADIVSPFTMKDEMVKALDQGIKDDDPEKHYEACFDGIATVLAMAFLMWLPMQQVMLVMGKGPIPTFAPPYVPVGPVVGGDNIAVPGHLAA